MPCSEMAGLKTAHGVVMKIITSKNFGRRRFLTSSVAFLAAPALSQTELPKDVVEAVEIEEEISTSVRRNISSFRAYEWQPYFKTLRRGAILVDITSRVLHYWSADGLGYKLYPTSVPISEDLTRRGRTQITRLVDGPSWRPTPAMKSRNPDWPDYVPPGPDNPLGTHALHLSWQYYRIHGTHDTRKIGRRSSNGCIGLYNQHIADLYGRVQLGTQVLLI